MTGKRRIGAFTLLEVMVAVVILAIVASMATAGYTRYRDRAQIISDEVNEKVILVGIKLSAYDNNSLPGSLSELKPEYFERAYAQVTEGARPYTLLACLQEWFSEGVAEAYTLDKRYLGPNRLRTLTCLADPTRPSELANGTIVNPSYALNAVAANKPLSWLLDPANAGVPLVFESDDSMLNVMYRHRQGDKDYCVATALEGVMEQVEASGNLKGGGNYNNKHGAYWPPKGSGGNGADEPGDD